MKSNRKAWLILGIVWIAFTMRSPMSCVGPLVPYIKADLGLSSGVMGTLTTIPILFFAAVAPITANILRIVTVRAHIFLCLVLVLSGILIRSYCGGISLFVGTALLGLGIGMLNIVMPIVIKTAYPDNIGLVMGAYTASMTALSAFASGLSAWLERVLSGWNNALAVFAILPFVALLIWLPVSRDVPIRISHAEKHHTKHIISDRTNWYIAIFMGMQSILYFCTIAWLPSVLTERGITAEAVALQMLLLQLISLLTNFATPIAAQRAYAKGWLAVLAASTYTAGFLILLLGSSKIWILYVSVILLGLAGGMGLSLALTFIALKGTTQAETTRLSAFSQTIGYLLAAAGPSMIGFIADWSDSFTIPIVLLLVFCIFLCLSGRMAESVSH